VQTDQSIDSATATTRRTFLTRTAIGGAVVTAGALGLPLGSLLTSAGARPTSQGQLRDAAFAAFAAPLELGAVAAYTAAFDQDVLDDKWSAIALEFQSHHQAVADTLIALGDENAPTPVADAAFTAKSVDTIRAASSQDTILLALATVEETLAATHLAAIGVLREKSTAKTVTQVLAVEGQQAAFLAVGAGTPVAEVTPATSSGDAALTLPKGGAPTTTTTTTATAATTTTAAN
jgi:hypothetical protein